MYEENADDYVHKYMGIALKRRDNAPIVKTIYGGAMKMLLDKRDVVGAFQFVKEKCVELVEGRVSMGQLTVTKSLRDHYADPTRIAHKVLSDRIAERDPGNAPAAGDRIGYIYIAPKGGQEAAKLQGDRIETPTYIREHGLTPDYKHYIEHQLMNPISQAFALLLERIPGFEPSMVRGCPSVVENVDKYLAIREGVAAQLLFGDAIRLFDRYHQRTSFVNLFRLPSSSSSSSASSSSSSSSSVADKKTPEKRANKTSVLATMTMATKQTTMSSFLLDSAIMDGVQKRRQSARLKDKADKA